MIDKSKIILRAAIKQDLAELIIFEQLIIQAERPFDHTIRPDPVIYYDLNELMHSSESTVIIAEYENKIIATGYAKIKSANPEYIYTQYTLLGFMCVHPDYRGCGLNKLIVDEAIKWSHIRNVFEIRLEVYDKNESAIKAYEKSGFVKHIVEMRLNEQ